MSAELEAAPVTQPVRLADYRPPDYLIDAVDLDISLDPHATRVVSRLSLRPNPAGRPARRLSSTATTSIPSAPPSTMSRSISARSPARTS